MKEGGLRTKGILRQSQPDFPLISIVMVTWNAEKHFRQALESVCTQDYPNKEIIVIDGGSSDRTIPILEEFSDRVDYWISEPDQGIYDAMNKGIQLSCGDWIGFKNADDWYASGALTMLVKRTKEFPDAAIWYGNSYSVIQEEPLKLAPFITNHLSLGGNPGIDHRCSFVRGEVHRRVLFDLQYRLAADLDVFWRLKLAGFVFRHTGEFMAFKRFGGASDGTAILKESFRINTRHGGWFFAVRSVMWSRIRYIIWKTGNAVLLFLMGKEAFHRFKSRRLQKQG
jgi:glycosyltransferase involved in cell wall biosynthesis